MQKPFDRFADTFMKSDVRTPTKQLLLELHTRCPRMHPLRFRSIAKNLGWPMADDLANRSRGITDFDNFVSTQVDRATIRNLFSSKQHSRYNVIDISKIPILLTGSPDFKWVHAQQGFRNKGNDRMSFILSRAIHSKEATRNPLQLILLMIRSQSHFAHQFCPAVLAVGQSTTLAERICHFLRKITDLTAQVSGLQVRWIGARRTRETDPLDAGILARFEHVAVDCQIL